MATFDATDFANATRGKLAELPDPVLNNTRGRVLEDPALTLRLTRQALQAMLLQGKIVPELVQAGLLEWEGDVQAFRAIVSNIVVFDRMFSIVMP